MPAVKKPPALQETQKTQVWPLGQEDPLKEEMTAHGQYSCWENLVDRGTWTATVHGVSKSRTWLKWLSTAPAQRIFHFELTEAPEIFHGSLSALWVTLSLLSDHNYSLNSPFTSGRWIQVSSTWSYTHHINKCGTYYYMDWDELHLLSIILLCVPEGGFSIFYFFEFSVLSREHSVLNE